MLTCRSKANQVRPSIWRGHSSMLASAWAPTSALSLGDRMPPAVLPI